MRILSTSNRVTHHKVCLLILAGFLILTPMTSSYAQLDPVSMVVGDFLQDRLIELFKIESIKTMFPKEGQEAINKGFELAKQDVDKHYREKQKKLCNKYSKKLEGRNVINPDANTKKIIDVYNKKMDALLKKWADEEKTLEQQRKECIEYYSKYWNENLNNAEIINL